MEHCGDDFIASMAESMQENEDWDDLEALESEACGTLSDLFNKDIPKNNEGETSPRAGSHICIIDDSPEPKKCYNSMELDSSSGGEDTGLRILKKKDKRSAQSSLGKRPSKSAVRKISSNHSMSQCYLLHCRNPIFWHLGVVTQGVLVSECSLRYVIVLIVLIFFWAANCQYLRS